MRKKQDKREGEGLANVALQTMALTLAEYSMDTVKGIYQLQDLPTTLVEKTGNQWLHNKWVKGEWYRYSWYRGIQVTATAWSDIMRTIDPKQVARLRSMPMTTGQKKQEIVRAFTDAFLAFVNGQPYEKLVEGLDWDNSAMNNDLLKQIVFHMAHQPENVPFLKHVDEDVLLMLFHREYLPGWLRLEPQGDKELLRELFWENDRIDEKIRHLIHDCYLYAVEFMRTGHLYDVLKQMWPDTIYHNILGAVALLHEGKPLEAYQRFTQCLKSDGRDAFNDAFSNFAYAVAIGLSGDPKAAKQAQKLMKSRRLKGSPVCYAMLLALHHYFCGDAATFFDQKDISIDDYPLAGCLTALLLRHYQVLKDDSPLMALAERWVLTSGFDYLRVLFIDDFDKLKPIADKLRERTGLQTSVLPTERKKERWELVIEQLMKVGGPNAGSARKAEADVERVAYVVNTNNFDVQPKLQKSKDGGITWSKGRNIAMKSFASGGEKCMNAQDHRVAALVKQYDYWGGGASYELGGAKVIAALVGCQSVFSATTDERLDIVEEPVQLTVQAHGNGYTVGANVDVDNLGEGISVQQVGGKQLTVVAVAPEQKRTLELLREIRTFPKESKSQLTTLLQTLSGSMTVMSPLLKNASDMKRVESNAQIAVQIAPTDDQMFYVTLAVKPFGTCPPYQRPAKGMEAVSTTIDGERVQTVRDLKKEKSNLEQLHKLMEPFNDELLTDDEWSIDTNQCLELLDRLRTAQDYCFVEWPQGARMRVVRPMIMPGQLRLKISSAGQWFELEGDLKIGDKEKLKMAELLQRVRESNGNFIRLSDNEYVALSEQLRRQLQAIDKMLAGRGKDLKIAAMNGMQLSALEEMGAQVKADEQFRQLTERIKEAGQMQFDVPTNIHAELRPYQLVGYQWMSRLAHWGAGACLADDMGLGKTLQAITLMQSRAALGPQLVVMPTSLLHNWQSELKTFAPALSVSVLNQPGASRQKMVEEAQQGDVVLTTYGLLVTEGELLAQPTWTTIVLDEAHTIKNRDTQTSKAAMTLKADFRLMLTGTPLQNHLSEIWNLFQFANPGLLGSFQQFTDRFILPVERDHDQERQRLLRRMLSPFMLRRTKDDVLNELPEKTEITVRVELSADEQALYDNLRQQAIANLEQGTKSALQTLTEITRLRQAACHPRLVNDKLQIPSSKTAAFLNLVGELMQGGHRALVFSQFTSHLALIREALDAQHIRYLYLDGSNTPQERNRLVRRFQTGDEPLFLISLKAGGLGLNLTAADYVIHLDPWWNPAVEDQASDRAYRIGQERPVTVYRLIAAGTVEEKIIRLHQNKRSLADALLQDADVFAQISADDVIKLLRESVDAIG